MEMSRPCGTWLSSHGSGRIGNDRQRLTLARGARLSYEDEAPPSRHVASVNLFQP